MLQRPKLDYYDNLQFLVLHALNPTTLEAEEVDLFLGPTSSFLFIMVYWKRWMKPGSAFCIMHMNVPSGHVARCCLYRYGQACRSLLPVAVCD